jgi:EAL domain-containing protein (putative c-di-GMP-specific phosphodiesterase class I)
MADVTLARLSGGDFAVLYEGAGSDQLKALAGRLAQGLGALYGEIDLPDADVGQIGGALYRGQAPGELMSQADMALRQAQQLGANAWRILETTDVREVHNASAWKELLERALENGFFRLQKQAVFACPGRESLHEELFLRLVDPENDGTMIPAGVFMPMAEAMGLAARVDRWVLAGMMEHAAEDPGRDRLAVNMSAASLRDERVIDWLQESLERSPDRARRLILEWSEYAAISHHASLKAWVERLSPLGVEFSLDHFGKGFSSFSAVRELKLHYLKIDGSFCRDLEEGEGDASFLRAVTGIAHGLDLTVIAESVESATAWERLAAIGVDGGRGYWLAPLSGLGD